MQKRTEIVKWKASWGLLEQELNCKLNNATNKVRKETLSEMVELMSKIKESNTTIKTTNVTTSKNSTTRKKKNSQTIKSLNISEKVHTVTSSFLEKFKI